MSSRPFEVVVMGATGFTGRLVAEYLLKQHGNTLRWAMAGRSLSKLRAVQEEIGQILGDLESAKAVPVIVADSSDEESLNAMCAKTLCVVSTVGPFCKYGELLVKCCICNQTAYCDSTGETPWIRKMIDKYQDSAMEKNVRLVPSCAFDSLPSDLGAMIMVMNMQKHGESSVGKLTHYMGPYKGGVSGGTIHTILAMGKFIDRDLIYKANKNPYILVPKEDEKEQKQQDEKDQAWFKRVDSAKIYTAPFIMGPGNSRVVRRSAAIMGYGDNFRFQEIMAYRSGFKAFFAALAVAVGTFFILLPPARWMIAKLAPAPGEGPSRELMEKGYSMSTIIASSENGKEHYAVEVGITHGDAGYRSTSFMLAESAVALARSKDAPGEYGFLTPASCPGLQQGLAKALDQNCGIWFKFSKHDSLKGASQLIKTFDSKL